jgi:hypothetical protein
VDTIVKRLFEEARTELLEDSCWSRDLSNITKVGELNKVVAVSILQRHFYSLRDSGKLEVQSFWNEKL